MQLQRYLRKNEENAANFGNYSKKRSLDFDWYFGEHKIGIRSQPSCEGESFPLGFLTKDDKLIITPDKAYQRIERESDKTARMSWRTSDAECVNALIKLLLANKTTHSYVAFLQESDHSGVLTFASCPPPTELYEAGKPMPIQLEEEYRAERLKSFIARITSKQRREYWSQIFHLSN